MPQSEHSGRFHLRCNPLHGWLQRPGLGHGGLQRPEQLQQGRHHACRGARPMQLLRDSDLWLSGRCDDQPQGVRAQPAPGRGGRGTAVRYRRQPLRDASPEVDLASSQASAAGQAPRARRACLRRKTRRQERLKRLIQGNSAAAQQGQRAPVRDNLRTSCWRDSEDCQVVATVSIDPFRATTTDSRLEQPLPRLRATWVQYPFTAGPRSGATARFIGADNAHPFCPPQL